MPEAMRNPASSGQDRLGTCSTRRKQSTLNSMIQVTPTIAIDESELHEEFVRASGPGGQNVNKVSSAVQLRFDVRHSPSLPAEVRDRLIRLGGKRVTDEGVLIIDARQHRTQDKNRRDAVERLVILICKAAERPPVRKRVKPTRAAKERRLEGKKRRSRTKHLRGPVHEEE
jgi:ribosome-associated protein